ncbi:MAG: DUF4129 domain-containing protein [Planctomycetales bacterium]|nr:DUF4129 domain-containing protein [Planctomycetales bacterium]
MARRLQKTLTDYLVLAITPGLLIVMIASLAFYLIACFYGGEHVVRLKVITFLFVMGAVLTARIAIEEGKEYASLFAFPLCGVVFLAAQRFVQLGVFLNLGLIALIWWSAGKLTWDSTVIDDSEGSTGEGLLETSQHRDEEQAQLEATTTRGADVPLDSTEPIWKRWLTPKQRPHTPGRWVIYFVLGAIPLLAIGNWQVSEPKRGEAFTALSLFVASALAVLLANSFLGLRKYLRQRRLEMPMEMAAVWLACGAVMIGAVMLACLVLPRPGVQLAGEPTWQFGSTRLTRASDYAQGSDSADSKQGSSGARDDQRGGKQSGDKQSGDKQSGDKQSGDKQSGDKQSGDKQSGDKQSGDKQSGDKQSGDKQSGDKQSGDKQSGDKQSGDKQSGDKQSGGKQSGDKQSGDKQSGDKQSSGKQLNNKGNTKSAKQADNSERQPSSGSNLDKSKDSERKSETSSRREQAKQPSRTSSSRSSRSWARWLSSLPKAGMRLIYWLGLALLVGYLCVRYREEIAAAWQQFVADLKRLWERLFGGRSGTVDRESADEPGGAPARVVRFADFRNPFATEAWRQQSAEELVRYSFAASEAWAAEHQCARSPEQTPNEFAQSLAQLHPDLKRPATSLGQLYTHAAYGPRQLPPASVEHLHQLWEVLQRLAAVPPAAPAVAGAADAG